jgi:hypothetical protein
MECAGAVSVDEIKEWVATRFKMLLDDLLPVDSGDIINTWI